MIKRKVTVLPYCVTINQSPPVAMMFNLMTKKKIAEQFYYQKQCSYLYRLKPNKIFINENVFHHWKTCLLNLSLKSKDRLKKHV